MEAPSRMVLCRLALLYAEDIVKYRNNRRYQIMTHFGAYLVVKKIRKSIMDIIEPSGVGRVSHISPFWRSLPGCPMPISNGIYIMYQNSRILQDTRFGS